MEREKKVKEKKTELHLYETYVFFFFNKSARILSVAGVATLAVSSSSGETVVEKWKGARKNKRVE